MSRERCRVYFISTAPSRPPLGGVTCTLPACPAHVTPHLAYIRAYPIYIHEWTNGVWNFISSTIWDEISCKLSLWRNQICMSPPAPRLASPRLDASRLPSRFIGFINSKFALLFSTSSTSKRTYWSVFEWNIISHSRRFMHPVYIHDVIRSCFSSQNVAFIWEWTNVWTEDNLSESVRQDNWKNQVEMTG